MKSAWLRMLVLCVGLGAAPALAQDTSDVKRAADYIQSDTLRLTLGAGFALGAGAFVDIEGRDVSTERPRISWLPSPIVRADMPVSELLLLGVQCTFLNWETDANQFFDTGHKMFDIGALVRFRIRSPAGREYELLFSTLAGPTFDLFDLGPRNYGSKVHNEVGWHAGLIVSFQYVPNRNWVGYFGETGFTHHSIPKTLDHGTSREDVLYDVKALSVRGGFIFLPFR